jgi:hypothetical protein
MAAGFLSIRRNPALIQKGANSMNEQVLNMVLFLIPIIGAVITGIFIPYVKTKISASQLDEIVKWVSKAVQAAEVLFDAPKSGEAKREYVITFIDRMFNSKKQVITKDQIRILLEAAWKQLETT